MIPEPLCISILAIYIIAQQSYKNEGSTSTPSNAYVNVAVRRSSNTYTLSKR